jgi:hypothetical protein
LTKSIFGVSIEKNLTYSEEFQNFGFNSNLVLLNLNSNLYYLLIFPLYWLLNEILGWTSRFSKLRETLETFFKYKFFQELFYEEFIQIFLATCINLSLFSNNEAADLISFIFSILLLCLHLFSIVYTSIYDNGEFRLQMTRTQFILRRFLYCLSLLLFNSGSLQLITLLVTSSLQLMYLVKSTKKC